MLVNQRAKLKELFDGIRNVYEKVYIEKRDTQRNQEIYQTKLDYTELQRLYLSSPIANIVVTKPVSYANRNGVTIECENENILEIVKKRYYELDVDNIVRNSMIFTEVFGGNLLLADYEDFDQSPLVEPNFTKMHIEKLNFTNIEWNDYYIMTRIHEKISRIQIPESYVISGAITLNLKWACNTHSIRVPYNKSYEYKYQGMSLYELIYNSLISDELVSKAVSNITNRGSNRVFKIAGLKELVASGQEDIAKKRVQLIEEGGSYLDSLIVDIDDDVSVISQSFQNLPELDERAIGRISAVTGIPATVLQGKSPDGMNSTGNADLSIYNAYLEDYQKRMIKLYDFILKALFQSASGKEDIEFDYNFNDVFLKTSEQKIDSDKKVLEVATGMEGLGVKEESIENYINRNLQGADNEIEFDEDKMDDEDITEEDISNMENPEPDKKEEAKEEPVKEEAQGKDE